jgi:hypothetical protein
MFLDGKNAILLVPSICVTGLFGIETSFALLIGKGVLLLLLRTVS